MHLNTKLLAPDHMKIHISMIPQEVIDEYNPTLDEKWYAYVEITGAIYGLSQAGYLANKDLIKNLAPFNYYPSKRTPGLWHHKTCLIKFTLLVDNFGVKYENKVDILHLLELIKWK